MFSAVLVSLRVLLSCFTGHDTTAELETRALRAFPCPAARCERRGMPQRCRRSIVIAVSFIWFEVYILRDKHLVCGLTTRVV